MMQKTLLDQPYAQIVFDPDRKRLYQTWIGFATANEFIAAIDVSVRCFQQHEVETILSDTTDQAVLSKAGSDYAASVMPELMKNGMKKIAFVLPRSAFVRLSLQNFKKNADSELIGNFSSREEAEAWLDS
ncbi:hypothetical protein [Cesiribacter andamanensis]|uniref:STAS/SEC14 domain-containing protein n=1 Tax=Cesiribacter andamanensis AMV16 TaxID=1279009 RepID=M7NSD7_9BACT|nr:hypothetical protein [Cesiribacter andamanensis]EMR01389.1 hypothetical protein ADICEAN_03477 [Cesiribacter andamanensis AMV16]